MIKKVMTKAEKMTLLKHFLQDEVYVKAIIETLSPTELDKWLNENVDTMLLKIRGKI